MRMTVQENGSTFYAALEENEAAHALVELMEKAPVTIAMSDYAGFEKVGPLGQSLPASNSQTTTQAADIVPVCRKKIAAGGTRSSPGCTLAQYTRAANPAGPAS